MHTDRFIVKHLFIDVNVLICVRRLQSPSALLLSSFSQLHFSFKLMRLPQLLDCPILLMYGIFKHTVPVKSLLRPSHSLE